MKNYKENEKGLIDLSDLSKETNKKKEEDKKQTGTLYTT